jgi:hypothetical protein
MKLAISPNFDVDDIRKVRDYEYEMTKNMSWKEFGAYLETNAAPLFAEIERLRADRIKNNSTP